MVSGRRVLRRGRGRVRALSRVFRARLQLLEHDALLGDACPLEIELHLRLLQQLLLGAPHLLGAHHAPIESVVLLLERRRGEWHKHLRMSEAPGREG